MGKRSVGKTFLAMPATVADANAPVSVGRFRALADNGLHLGDSCGRVLVNLQYPGGLLGPLVGLGEYNKIVSIPVRLTVDSNGIAYPVRIRIAGCTDGKAGTVSFRAVLTPRGVPSVYYNTSDDLVTETSNTSVTTVAWLTTTSTLLQWDSRLTALALSTDISTDDGTAQINVTTYKANLDIYGKRVASNAEPSLLAVYAAEYVGV